MGEPFRDQNLSESFIDGSAEENAECSRDFSSIWQKTHVNYRPAMAASWTFNCHIFVVFQQELVFDRIFTDNKKNT